jgi:hypothetical protein
VVPASATLAYVGLPVTGNGDVNDNQSVNPLSVVCGQGEADNAAPVVPCDIEVLNAKVVADKFVNVSGDGLFVVAPGWPPGIT